MPQLFAAVDLGAESGRVLAGRFDGQRLQLEDVHRFANVPVRVGGTIHWDVLRLWHEVQDGLRKVGAMGEVAGIGVDTWGVDFGLLDAQDQLIGNPVHYRDARNDGMMARVLERVPREQLFDATGLQFLPFNTLFQLEAGRDNPQLKSARALLFMPDLLHFFLTGIKANEYTIASTSQMLDARHRTWDMALLNHLKLPTDLLQELVAPGTVLGSLREDVAANLGLNSHTPVIAPGSHDTASAVAAVPAQGDNWAYLSSGTWSLMGLELRAPIINARTLELGFTNEGGVDGTIRFLKNIAGLWLVQECRRSFVRAGREFSYAELTQLAADAKPFGAIIEPDDASFAAPQDMPKAIRDFCARTNQSAPQDEGEMIRCCLESLALKYRRTLEQLDELRGRRIDVLHIVGGGTQNQLLSRLTTDCIGRRVVCGPVEATAIGNILTQAVARGELSGLAQMRDVVRASFPLETLTPNASATNAWDASYERFLTVSGNGVT